MGRAPRAARTETVVSVATGSGAVTEGSVGSNGSRAREGTSRSSAPGRFPLTADATRDGRHMFSTNEQDVCLSIAKLLHRPL